MTKAEYIKNVAWELSFEGVKLCHRHDICFTKLYDVLTKEEGCRILVNMSNSENVKCMTVLMDKYPQYKTVIKEYFVILLALKEKYAKEAAKEAQESKRRSYNTNCNNNHLLIHQQNMMNSMIFHQQQQLMFQQQHNNFHQQMVNNQMMMMHNNF